MQKAFDLLKCEEQGYVFDGNKSPYGTLLDCEGLIVNNSALMYKALAMGIKVASCDRGVYSGSKAILDCSRNVGLLKYIFDFVPNFEATMNLLCAIQINSVSRNANSQELLHNTNFANWLIRMIH
jgi:hypothetical protein